jgi:hypothetical protein
MIVTVIYLTRTVYKIRKASTTLNHSYCNECARVHHRQHILELVPGYSMTLWSKTYAMPVQYLNTEATERLAASSRRERGNDPNNNGEALKNILRELL